MLLYKGYINTHFRALWKNGHGHIANNISFHRYFDTGNHENKRKNVDFALTTHTCDMSERKESLCDKRMIRASKNC